MINVLRKNQKALWIVIAVLCIPFVFYFSNADFSAIGSNRAGHIYGEPVSNVEFQRHARMFNLARELGMFTYLQDLVGAAQSQDEAFAEFIWNRLVLRHEAEQLGIRANTGEIAQAIKELRPFRGEKGFDIERYNQFAQTVLPAMGFTEAHLEELVADQLALARLKEIIGAGVHVPEAEGRENYERAFGQLNVSVVRLRSEDFAGDVQINDEDIAKYFEANRATLNTEEKRRISLITFGLTEEQKKLAGKERVAVLQKLADQANDFSQALLQPGAKFEEIAAKAQLPIQTTGEFTKAAPDPLISANPQAAEAAFRLTAEESHSDPLQIGDSFQILHLSGVEPTRPLTLEEARAKVAEAIKTQRVRELVAAKGAEVASKIREALQGGAPVEAALQQTGLPPEKLPPFALSDQPTMKVEPGKPPQPQQELPETAILKGVVPDLAAGEVSQFVPTETGGLVAVLEKREQPDMATYEKTKMMFNSRALRGKREIAFYEWLRERRREAGVRSNVAEPAEAAEPAAG